MLILGLGVSPGYLVDMGRNSRQRLPAGQPAAAGCGCQPAWLVWRRGAGPTGWPRRRVQALELARRLACRRQRRRRAACSLALANAQAWHEFMWRWLRRQLGGGDGLTDAAGVKWLGDSLAAGFVLMAASLLGAALGLPVLLNCAGGAAGRSCWYSASGFGWTAANNCRLEPGIDGAAAGPGREYRRAP